MTSRELFDYLGAQFRDPAVPLPLRDLHDLSRVERFEAGSDDFRRVISGLQEDLPRFRDARLAIIAPMDHVYGMYRMFELLSEHASPVEELRQQARAPEVRVFRQPDEARERLLSAGGKVSAQAPDS